VHDGNLLDRARQDDLRQYEEKFQEITYLFSSLAKSLVDYSRRLIFDSKKDDINNKEKVIIVDYEERKLLLCKNHRHGFITGLRDYLHHFKLQKSPWELSTNENYTHTTKIILDSTELAHSGFKWESSAKQYLKENSQGLDLAIIIDEYQKQINDFYEWLFAEIDKSNKADEINEYLSLDKFIKAIGARSHWNFLLSQIVIQKKLNPYQYLDKLLKPSEIEEIQNLPNKSKQQVDKIIEILDDYGACDDNLRSLVYKAFSIE
jgi:hypothetical protein